MSRPHLQELAAGIDSGSSLGQSSLASSPISRPIFRALPKSPRPSFLHSKLPSKDTGELPIKTRLVEQFYKTDQAQLPRPLAGLSAVFRSGDVNTLPMKSLGQNNLDDVITKGQLAYRPLDADVPDASELLEALMHFDGVYDDENVLHLAVVEHAIELVGRVGKELLRVLATRQIEPSTSASHQLSRLSEYLHEMQELISKVQHDLSSTTTQLKAQYHDEMKASMDKLENLELTLRMLSIRLDKAKRSIGHSKLLLQDAMAQKLTTLEFISVKFAEYDQLNRQRRVGQLIVALLVAVAVLVVYSAWSHR